MNKKDAVSLNDFFITGDILPSSLLALSAGMLFVFAFIHDPAQFTISLIGTEHPVLFFFTCAAMSFATLINVLRLFRSSGVESDALRLITYASNGAMVLASVTSSAEYVRGLTELHWFCAVMFMAVNPLMLLVCALKRIKRGEKKCKAVIAVFLPVYLCDIIYILSSVFSYGAMDGKNGIMELIPIFSTMALLYLFNFTPFLSERDALNEEASLKYR